MSAKNASAAPYEVVLRGGQVIDGTGQPGRRTDVGIRGGRIAAIGDLSSADADAVIDVRDRVVCPGFVDLHSHADRGILEFRDAENYIRQGVTTLVCGNCGSSPTDIPAFKRALRDGGTGPNVVLLVGHGSVRGAVIGHDADAPSVAQLAAMQNLVRRAMEAGAVGVSSGLRYRLGAYATTDEVIAVVKSVAPFGGFYATHMRDEGVATREALEEALCIGRTAGVPVHVSHHKISSASVWGDTAWTLERINRARAAAWDVTVDQYPYGAGSSGISLMVPQETLAGGLEAFRERVADDAERARILDAVESLAIRKLFERSQSPADADATAVALARIQIARCPADPTIEGKNLTEILRSRGRHTTLRAGVELIVTLVEQGATAIYHTIEDRAGGDVDRVMVHPQTCIASDGSVFAWGDGHPHPRSYGTYPRVLSRYVRHRRRLSLVTAIHKMTGLPAQRLGWRDRGRIEPGHWADLVVLDPEGIHDLATFQEPHRYSVGVDHVLVRGEFVLQHGRMTGRRPGRPVMSVPVANTPDAKLRRDLLELLQRHDGHFGLYASAVGDPKYIAINADDVFVIPAPDESSWPSGRLALRHLVERLAQTSLRSYELPDARDESATRYFLFTRLIFEHGGAIAIAIAYDQLSAHTFSAVEKTVHEEVLPRLRKRFDAAWAGSESFLHHRR